MYYCALQRYANLKHRFVKTKEILKSSYAKQYKLKRKYMQCFAYDVFCFLHNKNTRCWLEEIVYSLATFSLCICKCK